MAISKEWTGDDVIRVNSEQGIPRGGGTVGSDVTICKNGFSSKISNVFKNIRQNKETLSKTTIEWKPFQNILFWNNVKYSHRMESYCDKKFISVTRNFPLYKEIFSFDNKFLSMTR